MALTPIPFGAAAAQRQGTFFAPASPVTYPGGYAQIYCELDIPNAAEYENAANEVDVFWLVNGVDSEAVWVGGRVTNKLGVVDPAPAFALDLKNVKASDTLQAKVVVKNSMTVGVKNGLIS